jgi:1,4-dihydroxy-2-naphthoate polyprenyltransferase
VSGGRSRSTNGRRSRLVAFIRLSRPWFLVGAALLLAIGAVDAGLPHVRRLAPGLAMVWSAQLTAHYLNEYADLAADRSVVHRTPFSGGSGVLVAGELPPVVALRAAWITTAATLVSVGGVALLDWLAGLAGLVALGVSWAYSMPPTRLLSSGWGELATSVTVGCLVPLTGVRLMGGRPTPDLWWVVGVTVSAHFAMMLVFELPDLASDAAAGKRVLGVRLGRGRTLAVIIAAHVVGVATGVTALGPSPLWLVAGVAASISWWASDDNPLAANSAAVLVVLTTAFAGLGAVA